MSFLAKALGFGGKFLGKALKVGAQGGNFLGKALPMLSSGLNTASSLVMNPLIQQIGSKVGIKPGVFGQVGQGLQQANSVIGALPGAYSQASQGFNQAGRSLADLYSLAHR